VASPTKNPIVIAIEVHGSCRNAIPNCSRHCQPTTEQRAGCEQTKPRAQTRELRKVPREWLLYTQECCHRESTKIYTIECIYRKGNAPKATTTGLSQKCADDAPNGPLGPAHCFANNSTKPPSQFPHPRGHGQWAFKRNGWTNVMMEGMIPRHVVRMHKTWAPWQLLTGLVAHSRPNGALRWHGVGD
jgi:hypothetical protein